MRCSFEIADKPCCREYLSGARRLLVRCWRVSCQSLAKRWWRLLAKLNKPCFGNYHSHGGGVVEKSACCWLAHIMDRKSCGGGGGGASPFITCHHHWLTPWKSATTRNWRRARDALSIVTLCSEMPACSLAHRKMSEWEGGPSFNNGLKNNTSSFCPRHRARGWIKRRCRSAGEREWFCALVSTQEAVKRLIRF